MLVRLIALLALFALPAAAAESASTPFPVPQMMAASGLDHTFDQFGASIAASFRTSPLANDKSFLETWQAAAATSFDAVRMTTGLGDALARTPLGAADQQALKVFFDSDLGKRVTALDTAMATMPVDAVFAALETGQKLVTTLPAARFDQYSRFFDATTETSAELSKEIIRAIVLSSVMARRTGDIDPPWTDINAAVEGMMPMAMAAVRQQQIAQAAFAYQSLSNEDMEAYLSFLATPAARAFYASTTAAMGVVIGAEMDRFAKALAQRRPASGA